MPPSRRTLIAFREHLVGWVLRRIGDEFDAAGIEANLDFGPDDLRGERRIYVEQHYSTLDLDNPSDEARLIEFLEGVLMNTPEEERGQLVAHLQRDGYMYDDFQIKDQEGARAAVPITDEPERNQQRVACHSPEVFISHSHEDVLLATKLTRLLKAAFHFSAADIRCTSVPGHKLDGGADADETIRTEVVDAGIVIGLLSPASLESAYVAFELGARWGFRKPLVPMLAPGVDHKQIKGPLAGMIGLRCDSESDLHQLIDQLRKVLEKTTENTPAYLSELHAMRDHTSKPPSRPTQ